MRTLRRANEWLAAHLPATRGAIYLAVAITGFVWLLLVIAATRRFAHGLPPWSPHMTPLAMRSPLPLVVFTPVGLLLDWAARRARWWSHALAGAVVGALAVFLKAFAKLLREGTPINVGVLVFRWAPIAALLAAVMAAGFVSMYFGERMSTPVTNKGTAE